MEASQLQIKTRARVWAAQIAYLDVEVSSTRGVPSLDLRPERWWHVWRAWRDTGRRTPSPPALLLLLLLVVVVVVLLLLPSVYEAIIIVVVVICARVAARPSPQAHCNLGARESMRLPSAQA